MRSGVDTLRGDGRGRILTVVAVGWLLVLGTRVVLPALLPQVKTAFSIDNATAGLLVSVMWAAYAVTQFPAGMMVDRIGERTTLAASAVVTAAGAAALTFAPSFAVFVLGSVLFGLGSGLYAPPRVTVLSRIYPDRDGTALGITFAVGNLGAAALPLVAGALAVWVHWRLGFGFVVAPLALVAVGLWVYVPPRPSEQARAAERFTRRTAVRLLRGVTDRDVALAWVAMTLVLFAYQGITAFLPTYLIDVKGLTQGTASALYGLFYASGAASQWVAGNAADRYGERTVLASVAGFGVFTLVALPFVGGTAALAVLLALLGTRLGIGPVGNGFVAALLPEEIQGAGYGLFRTFYLAVGASGSLFVGVLAERGLFDEAFLALAGVTAVASVLYLFLPATPDEHTHGSETGRDGPTDDESGAGTGGGTGSLSSAAEPGSDADGENDRTTD
ncbi:nitrate/nitrite transporter [Halorussus sp. MSC15.2]|uniref:MFS transporter n=1 Tax=Halorussus sp. MSC15.2 TaxID=2283638 RepID=UPI0013CFD7CA|nr:MFS transporter [Halorussus sp. MSC15.2]NEU58660.1 MFS transporter [Halorussus sp. MSC15.2]